MPLTADVTVTVTDTADARTRQSGWGTSTWAGTGPAGIGPRAPVAPGGDRCGRGLFQLFTSGGQEDGAQALGEFGLGGDQRGEPVELAALGEFLFCVDDGLQRGLVGVQGTLPGGAGGLDGLLVELADLFHAGLDRAFGLRGGGLDRVSGLRGDRVGGFQEISGVLGGLLVRGAHDGFLSGFDVGVWGVRGGDSAAAMGKGSAPGPGPADHGSRTSAHLGVLFLHRTTAAAVAGVAQRRDHPAYIGIPGATSGSRCTPRPQGTTARPATRCRPAPCTSSRTNHGAAAPSRPVTAPSASTAASVT